MLAPLASTTLLAVALLSPNNTAGDYPTWWEQGMEAYRARDAEKMLDLFGRIVEVTPDRADAWYALSVALEQEGRLSEAVATAERAQNLGWEGGSRTSYRVAQLHARSGQFESALAWLERALAERYEERPGIADDPAFASMRDDERFQRIAGIPAAGDDATRDERWRFDLAYLVEEAQRLHADATRPAFDQEFVTSAASLHDDIPDLSDDEVFLRMMRLLAILNDGHTGLFGAGADSPVDLNGAVLPFKMYLFEEGLYVTDGDGAFAERAGQRIVRFGDIDAGEVLRRMAPYRGVDNPMTWTWMGPQFYVGRLLMLQAVGASADGRSVEVTFEEPDGTTSTERIEGGDHFFQGKLRPSPAASGEVPPWLSSIDDHFWFTRLDDPSVVYLQFNQVLDARDESIAEFAERLRGELNDEVETVIVDVRHNSGGNNTLVRPLVRALLAFELADPDHQLFVLTGRNTFSAAQNFVNRLERWTEARFAGEASASSPNFVGESTAIVLPYSRLRGSISSRYWQDSDPGDHRESIPLDIPVKLHAADYFAGRDPVLAAVLSVAMR